MILQHNEGRNIKLAFGVNFILTVSLYLKYLLRYVFVCMYMCMYVFVCVYSVLAGKAFMVWTFWLKYSAYPQLSNTGNKTGIIR